MRKLGAVIGRTTRRVRLGEHLHLDNLASNYLAAHLVGGASSAALHEAPEDGDRDRGRDGFDAAEGGAAGATPAPAAREGTPARSTGPDAAASSAAASGAAARGATAAAVDGARPGARPIPALRGFARSDGRLGIRNELLVVYLVECAHHVSRRIVDGFGDLEGPSAVQLVGFPGCYPNDYAERVLGALCTHPNVGGCLLVSLGCESFDRASLADVVDASGRWVETLVIQEEGGTSATIARGRSLVAEGLATIAGVSRREMQLSDLVVGTICGGSDSTSALTANPAVGRAFDLLVAAGAACIFEETGELIGCEDHLRARAADPQLGEELAGRIVKASRYYEALGHASIAPGNLAGGLTTIEEKSIGAYAKSGSSAISGVIEPGELPPSGGLYLLDIVPDGSPVFGYPNINDTTEIVELIACGSHVICFTTGRGSVVGSAVSPVIKVCANPETYTRMSEDMDVDAGRILDGKATLDEVGGEIFDQVVAVAGGATTRSEALGHQEFQLGYKVFRSMEPPCLA